MRFLIQNTTAPLLPGYEAIDSADVVSTYDNSSSSFHWLWRLQDDSLGAGVAWDVASVGSLTMRVYVTTRQEYEPYWLMLCWLGFGLRLAIFLAFDVLAGSMTTKCEYNGEEGNAEVEVLYLECFASKFTWLLQLS